LEWVYKEADTDHARIACARELDASEDQQLIQYFKERKV
jgi:hypothetical protein